MLLDNLFSTLGRVNTAALLLIIIVFVRSPAVAAVLPFTCPLGRLRERSR